MADRYFYCRPKTTRCFAELALLETMYQQGLPVPKPIAGRYIKSGLIYRADLLIEKIPKTCDLVAHLQKDKLTEANWHAVGSMIAKFHEAGIYHADLNAHNILVDTTPDFWLIDFDKCRRRNPEDGWQQANLDRLHRSFVKESKRHSTFYFDDQCWHWLISGYQSFYHLSPDARH